MSLRRLPYCRLVDGRSVRVADVVASAIHRCRIVDLKEEFENAAIAGPRRIEYDLDTFGAGAVVATRGFGLVAAGIAYAGLDPARQLADQVLHAPEAAIGELLASGIGCPVPLCSDSNRRHMAIVPLYD